jgi:hypothetical protein
MLTLLNLLCDDEAGLNQSIKHVRKNRSNGINALYLVEGVFE